MKFLFVELLAEFTLAVLSQLHDLLLAQHVGSGLTWSALVTGDFFLRQFRFVPGVLREEFQSSRP